MELPVINPFSKSTHPFCHGGHKYALDVLANKIPTCKYIKGACKRYLDDLQKKEYPFNADKAERFLKLAQLFSHVKGKGWKSENIHFEPWQNFCFMNIFGFINPDTKERRFRIAHILIGRGNGKSLLASQVLLYLLALDDPKGNEISTAASKHDQARIVLDSSMAMAKNSPKYLKATGVKVLAHKITHPKSNSFARALSADSKSLDGLNDLLTVIDELHAVTRELFEVIISGMKKRNDSLLLCISTAGSNTEGIGYNQDMFARKVALGEVKDDTFFALVYTIDDGDDIYDENTWIKANPNYGVSVDPISFKASAEKTKIVPSDLPNFLIKNLNSWQSQAFAYFDINKFDACYDPQMKLEDFHNKPCYGAVDLASKLDLTCHGNLFRKDGHYYFFFDAFLPQATKDEAKSSIIYDEAVAEGSLIITPGEAINQETIENHYIKKSKNFRLKETMYDPWNAVNFAASLSKQGFEMVEFKQNTANYSEAMKTLAALIAEKKFHHNGSKLLRYCIGNVVSKEDANGNHFPRKTSDKLKIDIAVTLLMCLAAWLNEKQEESVYHERGIRRL